MNRSRTRKKIFSALSLCLALLFLFAQAANAQTLRPLSDVLEDRQGWSWDDIVDIAS